jgi:hypothetical protein
MKIVARLFFYHTGETTALEAMMNLEKILGYTSLFIYSVVCITYVANAKNFSLPDTAILFVAVAIYLKVLK